MQSPKAWIIDKDPNLHTCLGSFLGTIGYSAKCFSDGEESLHYLNEKPDFIILDCNQGGDLNSLDVLRTFKVNTAIPLIYISNDEKDRLISEAINSTASDRIETESEFGCLKSKIRKIERLKSLKRKRRKSKMMIFSLIGIVWVAGLVKFILNISL